MVVPLAWRPILPFPGAIDILLGPLPIPTMMCLICARLPGAFGLPRFQRVFADQFV